MRLAARDRDRPRGAAVRGRLPVCRVAFRDGHRQLEAHRRNRSVAPARARLRGRVPPACRPHCRRRRRRDARARRAGNGEPRRAACRRRPALSRGMAPRRRIVLRPDGPAVRLDGRSQADDAATRFGAAVARDARRRPEPARIDGRAGTHARRRAAEPRAGRLARAAARCARRGIRSRRRRRNARVLLANAVHRRRTRAACAAPLHSRAAGTGLRGASAWRSGEHGHSARGARPSARCRYARSRAAHRLGPARRRGVLDAGGRRRAEHDGDVARGDCVVVDRATLMAADRGRAAEPCRRIDRHRGLRAARVSARST